MFKKVIAESKSLGNLKTDAARLLYTWLIPFLDVEGRHSADPEIIKGHIFPKVKSITVEIVAELLRDLAINKLVILYRGNGETYLQFTKFHEYQKLDPSREAKSTIPAPTEKTVITLENSRPTQENSSTIKVKESKGKESKVNSIGRTQSEFDPHFEEFWTQYPKEGRLAKKEARTKFVALCKRGELEEFKKGCQGYGDFLKHKRIKEHFEQAAMYAKTFLNGRWKEYVGFKYEAPL
jgi:hypothetical protein